MRSILVADDEPITRMDIVGMVENLGFRVVGEAADGFDAVEACRRTHPDVVLMDVKMPVFDGLSAAETIWEEDLASCVILLTAYHDIEIIERAKRAGVNGYLVKPVEERRLLPAIEVAWTQSERLRQSRSETEDARRKLEDSRLIQQAQAIFAKREGVSESDAYQAMRRMAMEKRIQMAVLARALIDQERQTNDIAWVKKRLMQNKRISESDAFKEITEYAKKMKCSKEDAARKMRGALEKLL